jgi:hypothetical protein
LFSSCDIYLDPNAGVLTCKAWDIAINYIYDGFNSDSGVLWGAYLLGRSGKDGFSCKTCADNRVESLNLGGKGKGGTMIKMA